LRGVLEERGSDVGVVLSAHQYQSPLCSGDQRSDADMTLDLTQTCDWGKVRRVISVTIPYTIRVKPIGFSLDFTHEIIEPALKMIMSSYQDVEVRLTLKAKNKPGLDDSVTLSTDPEGVTN
jgi:hypothetical protein